MCAKPAVFTGVYVCVCVPVYNADDMATDSFVFVEIHWPTGCHVNRTQARLQKKLRRMCSTTRRSL